MSERERVCGTQSCHNLNGGIKSKERELIQQLTTFYCITGCSSIKSKYISFFQNRLVGSKNTMETSVG